MAPPTSRRSVDGRDEAVGSPAANAAEFWPPAGRRDDLLQTPSALNRAMMGLSVVCAALMAPFALNNFIHGRPLLGALAALLVAIQLWTIGTIWRSGRFAVVPVLLLLVPTIIVFLSTSVLSQGVIGVLWCFPGVIAFYVMLPERFAWIANAALLAIVLPIVFAALDPSLAARAAVTLLMVSALTAIFVNVINEQQRTLRLQSITDPLTGLLNRATLSEQLKTASQQRQRSQVPVSLIALDLDHFKLINDDHGHDRGDAVLTAFAGLLKARVRQVDRVFRLGGEEFLIVLYGADRRAAANLAEQLRTSTQASRPDGVPVTVSAGVAGLRDGEAWRSWMKRADANLYRAKHEGRNRVVA